MKLAFFHELHAGGARRSVREFGKVLKNKHKIDLYFVDDADNGEGDKIFKNVYFYKFEAKKWSGNNWRAKLYKDSIELIRLYFLHKKIAKEIDRENYDRVFIEPSKFTQAPFVLRFLKTKKIYYCQEPLRMVYEDQFAIDKKLPFIKYRYEQLNRYVRKIIDIQNIRHADKILSNSDFTKQNIRKAYNLPAQTSYMGVDSDIFRPVKIRKDIDVLYVGARDYTDGFFLLDKAKEILNDSLNIKILATEKQWISNDFDLRDLYCRSRLVLSLAKNEPFGLIPIEALSCGVPVVAIDGGGYRETIRNGYNGYLIKSDPKMLADKIKYLLGNKKEYERMSLSARQSVIDNWTWKKNSEKLGDIFEEII